MKDSEIDFTELPEVTPEMFARSIVRKGLEPVARKEQLTLRLDSDVLKWFRQQARRVSDENQRVAPSLHGRA